jgi:hypothetical protein
LEKLPAPTGVSNIFSELGKIAQNKAGKKMEYSEKEKILKDFMDSFANLKKLLSKAKNFAKLSKIIQDKVKEK